MLTLSGPELAQIASPICGAIYLLELQFDAATYRFSTFNLPLVIGGETYAAAGNLAGISDLHESLDSDAQTVTVSLSVANAATLGSMIGAVETYRGRPARIYLQLLDESFQPIGSPRLRFAGEMEPIKVVRDKGASPAGGRIELPISRAGLSRARNNDGARLTDEQQRDAYPGDRGLEYVRGLIERPTLWLSKKFQEQR
jgi:hypothetical protein